MFVVGIFIDGFDDAIDEDDGVVEEVEDDDEDAELEVDCSET